MAGGPNLSGTFPESAAVGEALRSAGLSIAVAESCTGGLLGAALTAVPGSSDYFRGGVVCYADDLKTQLLAVPAAVIASEGAVSEAVARQLALGVRRLCRADVGVGITGVAGPQAGEGGKPAGLIHVAVAGPAGEDHQVIGGDHGREENRALAVTAALRLCRRLLAARSDRRLE